jgi:hypothetical protein
MGAISFIKVGTNADDIPIATPSITLATIKHHKKGSILINQEIIMKIEVIIMAFLFPN